MHTVAREYALRTKLTLAKLMDSLPRTNDPGCSAGYAHGLVTAVAPEIEKAGPDGRQPSCARRPRRATSATAARTASGTRSCGSTRTRSRPSLQMCEQLGTGAAPDCAQGVYHDYWFAVNGIDDTSQAREPGHRPARAVRRAARGVRAPVLVPRVRGDRAGHAAPSRRRRLERAVRRADGLQRARLRHRRDRDRPARPAQPARGLRLARSRRPGHRGLHPRDQGPEPHQLSRPSCRSTLIKDCKQFERRDVADVLPLAGQDARRASATASSRTTGCPELPTAAARRACVGGREEHGRPAGDLLLAQLQASPRRAPTLRAGVFAPMDGGAIRLARDALATPDLRRLQLVGRGRRCRRLGVHGRARGARVRGRRGRGRRARRARADGAGGPRRAADWAWRPTASRAATCCSPRSLARALLLAAAALGVALDAPFALLLVLATLFTVAADRPQARPGRAAPAPRARPRRQAAANALWTAIDNAAFVARRDRRRRCSSPAFGAAAAFAASGVAFVAAALALARIARDPAPEVAARGSRARGRLEGLRVVARDRRLRLLVGVLSASTLVEGMVDVLVVVTALRLVDLGDAGVGWLNAAWGIGGLAGGAVALRLLARGRLALALPAGGLLIGAAAAAARRPAARGDRARRAARARGRLLARRGRRRHAAAAARARPASAPARSRSSRAPTG